MADNVTTQSTTLATIPASTKISTDEDATNGHVQRMKLAVSADGSSTHIGADADGLQVQGAAADGAAVTGKPVLIGGDDGTNAVNVAVDSDGAVHVADGGNSLTVDNAGTFAVQATALTPGTATGNLGKAMDGTAHVAPTGVLSLNIRNDTLASLVDADADYAPTQVNASGAIYVDGSNSTQPISGTVTANAGTGTFTVDGSGVTQPVSNTNLDNAHSADFDTGAGTDTTPAFGIAVPASGGAAVVPGDATAGLKVDLGADNDVTVTSGTITANLGATDNAVLDSIDAAVNGTLTVGSHDVTNAGTFATQATLQANSGVDIGDVDVISVTPGTGATNLGKAIDTAAGATDTGIAALAVRDDALTTLTPIDGDYVPLRVNSTGALHVTGAGGGTQYNVDDAAPTVVTMAGVVRDDALTTLTEVDGDATVLRVSSTGALHVTGGGGGTEYTDDTSTHATGSSVGNLMMAAATPTDGSVDANDIGAVAMSTDRRLHVDAQIVGQDADVTIADGGNSITVDGTVTANLSATDNAVLDQIEVNTSYGDNTGGGVEAGALRVTIANDSTGVVSVDDNGGSLTVDWNGTAPPIGAGTEAAALRVTLATDSTGVVSVDDGGGSLTVDGTVTASNAAGDVAHDTADSGNPVKVGGKAYNFDGTVPGTAVAENDRANFITDVYGRQYVETTHPNYWSVSADYAAAQTNATVKAAPGAGLKLYITDVIISNGATAGNITLLDGSGGTVLIELYPAINGGMAMPFRTPIALTANTLLAITSTTVTTHSVTINGYTAA